MPESVAEREASVGRDLLAAIYAAPRDDEPRAIYADWLLEHGDLHGEMIALQFADPNSMRAHQLSKQLRDRLLGPLAEYVEDERYERGFLARCTSRRRFWSRREDRTLPVDPRWATVREIRGAMPATNDHPMPALEGALDLPPEAFAQLAALATPPPLVRLGLHGETISERKVAAAAFAAFAPRMPTLRRLELRGGMHDPDDPSWPWAGTSIREVVVSARFIDAPMWFATALRSELDRFEVTAAPQWYQTAPTAVLSARTLHVHHVDPDGEQIDTIAELLEEIPRGRLASVKVVTAGAAWSLASRRRVENALDHHPGIAADIGGFSRIRG